MGLTQGQQIPIAPDVQNKSSMNKWIRDLNDYLRRLDGRFTAEGILNLFVEEGDMNNVFNDLVNFADFQTTALDSVDFKIKAELSTDSTAYTLFLDLSAISGFTAGNQQVLTHSASGGLAWVDTSAC